MHFTQVSQCLHLSSTEAKNIRPLKSLQSVAYRGSVLRTHRPPTRRWFVLQLVSLVALLLAWVYIFDTVQRERELLEGPKEGIVGAQGLQDPSQVAHTTTVFPPDRAGSSKGKDGEASGQAVELPAQMLAEAAEGRRIGDLYAPMQGQCLCLLCWVTCMVLVACTAQCHCQK